MEEADEKDETLSALRKPVAHSVRRQETQEEPEAQRQSSEEEEEHVAPLRRQETEEKEELAPLRRQETEEEEEQVARLRRQEDEEEVAPLRRQGEEEEEAIQTMRTIARQEEVPLEDSGQITPPPTQTQLEPGSQPVSQEFSNDEEPSTLQALHRDISPVLPQSSQPPQGAITNVAGPENSDLSNPSREMSASLPVPDFPDRPTFINVPSQTTGLNDSPPNVIIDQLDVLIHEPALPADHYRPHPNRDRSLRARYLRRL